jgi:hypothetical protein
MEMIYYSSHILVNGDDKMVTIRMVEDEEEGDEKR